MNRILKSLLWVYQLPQHLLALMLLGFLRLFKEVERDIQWKDSRLFVINSYKYNWGVSLGFFIFLTKGFAGQSVTIKHEHGHTIQSMILGPLYLLVVGIPSFLRASIWSLFGLSSYSYYKGYPERGADFFGGVKR